MRAIGILSNVLLFLMLSCSDRKPGGEILPEDQFTEIYSQQLVLLEEAKLSGSDPAAVERRIDSLYRAHDVTSRQVRMTLKEYQDDLPRWRHFQELVVKRLEAMQDEYHSKKGPSF